MTVSVNIVVLAGTIAADPVERRMPSGEECTEIRLSVPESGRRLLPLPVVAWHGEVGKERLRDLNQGDEVLVYGRLIAASIGAAPAPAASRRSWRTASSTWSRVSKATQTSIETPASDDACCYRRSRHALRASAASTPSTERPRSRTPSKGDTRDLVRPPNSEEATQCHTR
jgi:hypothetical protein